SLGVILYELLTGQWPFSGAAVQVMGQKCVLEPPAPLSVKPDLNPQLAAVCHQMIAKERQNRYQSAQEVRAALKAVDFGGATPGPPAAAPAAQASSGNPELPAFLPVDEPFVSTAARKRPPARRRDGSAHPGTLRRPIGLAILDRWNRMSAAARWGGAAVAVLPLAVFGLWAS